MTKMQIKSYTEGRKAHATRAIWTITGSGTIQESLSIVNSLPQEVAIRPGLGPGEAILIARDSGLEAEVDFDAPIETPAAIRLAVKSVEIFDSCDEAADKLLALAHAARDSPAQEILRDAATLARTSA